jgi:hypothetical protein
MSLMSPALLRLPHVSSCWCYEMYKYRTRHVFRLKLTVVSFTIYCPPNFDQCIEHDRSLKGVSSWKVLQPFVAKVSLYTVYSSTYLGIDNLPSSIANRSQVISLQKPASSPRVSYITSIIAIAHADPILDELHYHHMAKSSFSSSRLGFIIYRFPSYNINTA